MKENVFKKASHIWISETPQKYQENLYAVFKTHITPPAKKNITLYASVSGNLSCYINGKLAAFGQYTDYPEYKTFSAFDVTQFCMSDTENEILIFVHFSGNSFTSHYDGTPGMIAEIHSDGIVLSASGESWLSALDTRYSQGEREKLSSSLNYTFEFDSRTFPPVFTPSCVLKEKDLQILNERPTPACENIGLVKGQILSSGSLFRDKRQLPLGVKFASDIYDVNEQASNGAYYVFDLGREYTGFLCFEFSCDDEVLCDIAHGEYLKDTHLAGTFTNSIRHFTDRFHSSKGKNAFTHSLRRIGARFIEFHVIGNVRTLKFNFVGLLETMHRNLDTPKYVFSDSFWEKAHEISCETLRLNLHEKYENCPWREQSICACDARNQMLFGYGIWGNYVHARAMIKLFAQSLNPDGFLSVAVPSRVKFNIPSFTFFWFDALYEYTLYSGDVTLVNELEMTLGTMFSKILSYTKNALYVPPDTPGLWNYCEPPELEDCKNPPNAFYNLYLHEALIKTAELMKLISKHDKFLKYKKIADEIAEKSVLFFYDTKKRLFANEVTPSGKKEIFHSHIQMLFLERGILEKELEKTLMAYLEDENTKLPAIKSLPYLIRGVFNAGTPENRIFMHKRIKKIYSRMIDSGAQTWWEIESGSEYAAGAGSLCHGWSAGIEFYTMSYLLGITPLERGFKRFLVKIYPGDLIRASGEIVTPYGKISVSWEMTLEGLDIEIVHPKETVAVFESYMEAPIHNIFTRIEN